MIPLILFGLAYEAVLEAERVILDKPRVEVLVEIDA